MAKSNSKRLPREFLVVLAGLALFYALPFLLNLNLWGGRDWDLFTTIAAIPVGSIVDYGQFPFWNPYMGGGNILFHHPEVAVLSPFVLLYWICGAVVGLKLQVLICYFLGLTGSFYLGRTLGISRWGSLLLSVAYFGSVHFALHFAEGHMPFTHFCFLPWFLAGLKLAEESVGYLALSAGALALMVLGNGGAIPLLYTLTFSGLWVLLESARRVNLRPLLNLALATGLGLLVAAVKFVPMVVYLTQNQWAGAPEETIPLTALSSVFFGLDHSLMASNFEGQFWGWHEYGAYVSPLLILLVMIILVRQFKSRWPWMVLAVFFLLLGMGNFSSWSPWALLSQFPGFESARCTGRSFQFVILGIAVLAAFGYDSARAWIQQHLLGQAGRYRLAINVLHGVLAVICATNLILAWPIMSSAHRQQPVEIEPAEKFVQVVDKNPLIYAYYLAGKGSLITPWLSAYHPSRGLVDPTETVHEYYVTSGTAVLDSMHFTPNRLDYFFRAQSTGEMVVSVGFDPGWSLSGSAMLRQQQSLLAFPFSQGRKHVTLSYRTPYFDLGLILSLVGLGLLLALLYFRQVIGKFALGRDQ